MNDKCGPRFYSELERRGGETARNERGTPRYKR